MPLAAGTLLGPYEIVGLIGAGGMGEVYRAHDPRLGRAVAIKILPASFSVDPARLHRFEREAKAIGALNHPNIVAVYDTGNHDATPYLVTELLEGQTLRDKLTAGCSIAQALEFAVQIAEGLAAAHAQGIVHRDLKPENVFITRPGRVKILDFGLAKTGTSISQDSLTRTSPTWQHESVPGTVIGTVGYMSPEQVLGNALDHRSDIFSFGIVLFEMLVGQRPFQHDSAIETMHAILRDDPPDMAALDVRVPRLLCDVVQRCLAKEPAERWQSASDLAQALKWAGGGTISTAFPETSAQTVKRGSKRSARRTVFAVLIAIAAVSLVAASVYWGNRSVSRAEAPASEIARLQITLKPDELINTLTRPIMAISPDGSQVVYVRRTALSTHLYIRSVDAFESRPIPGTQGATSPFFSPDSKWVGFFADSKLKKVAVRGGAPLEICAVDAVPLGASWSRSGVIVLGSINGSGLQSVPDAGGDLKPWSPHGTRTGTTGQAWPEALPDGTNVIFTSHANPAKPLLSAESRITGESKTLIEGSFGRYVSPGFLVYVSGSSLMAVRFDLARLEVMGAPVVVLDRVQQVQQPVPGGAAQFSVSTSGSLVYLLPSDGRALDRSLMLVDRDGRAREIAPPARPYFVPRLSPDGRRIAVHVQEDVETNVWIYDIPRATWNRLTFNGNSGAPIWTPDGKYVTFAGPGGYIYRKAVDGSGSDEQLSSESLGNPHSWSPDGRWLATAGADGGRSWIWLLTVGNDRTPRHFLSDREIREQNAPAISPDGRWMAYVSNESGKRQIHVRSFPTGEGHWMVSTEGGTQPMWARDGSELFYRDGDKMMAVPIATKRVFTPGRPTLLFEGRYESPAIRSNYDVMMDGRSFVMVKANDADSSNRQLNIVLNWANELKRRVPPAQ